MNLNNFYEKQTRREVRSEPFLLKESCCSSLDFGGLVPLSGGRSPPIEEKTKKTKSVIIIG